MTRVFEIRPTEYSWNEARKIIVEMMDVLSEDAQLFLDVFAPFFTNFKFSDDFMAGIYAGEVDVNLEELRKRQARKDTTQTVQEMKEVVNFWRKRQREIHGGNGNE